MASKHHNPGCPCCELDFPCDPTDCGDSTTRNIRRVTLELVMPDEIVLIGQTSSSPTGRRLVRYTGCESISGTYTFELNEEFCNWRADVFPDTSGIHLENWLLRTVANCTNIESEIALQRSFGATPYHEGAMLANCLNINMQTFASGTQFSHEFNVSFSGDVACGGELGIRLWPVGGVGNLCGESSIVFRDVTVMQRTPGGLFGLLQFDCGDLSLITGTATSYET